MKYILISLIFVITCSCQHNIPIANLELTKIEKNEKFDNYYFIYFSSDIELIKNLSERHTGVQLKCFFQEKNINIEDFIEYQGYVLRLVSDIREISSTNTSYDYSMEVTFDKEGSEFSREKDLPEIIKLLYEKPDCLKCAVTAVAFMSTTNRYVSNTMCLPKKKLKNVIE